MKFSFDLKNKKASFEADIEKVINKGLEHADADPNKKTRYQIKQEEKRKNMELKHTLNSESQKEKANVSNAIPSNINVKKTRYQIKQEEKRKNAEQKHKHNIQLVLMAAGAFVALIIFVSIMSMLEG